MKVALVIERFDPLRGGAEHWTWQFARALVRRGHEVHVVAFEFHPRTSEDGIISIQLEMPKSRLDRAEAIAQRLAAETYDIVHDMGISWSADIFQPHAGSTIALWEHNLMRIPKWRQIRFWRERRYRELEEIERRQHQSNAVIVPVSRMLAREFETLHHLAPERMRVIYNGVDVERFSPETRDRYRNVTRQQLGVTDEVVFLMLAHNLLLKNAEAVIRAAATLVREGSRIRVAIGGGRKDKFVELLHKLRVSEAVTFVGLVDSLPWYRAADVYVQPTWYDPCSLVTLEASSCGLPVITSRFNGAAELMTDGTDGFVVQDPADTGTLAGRMRDLLDSTRRQEMGAAGRKLALRHTFEDQVDQFIDLYREIITARDRKPSTK